MSPLSAFVSERSTSVLALCLLGGSYILYFSILHLATTYRHRRFIAANNCKPVSSYPHKDPIFGLDILFENYKLSKTGGFFEGIQKRYARINGGVHTYSQVIQGERVVNTAEPENIKAILSTKFKDFELPKRRKETFAATFGHGIFTTDGEEWAASRALLRPSFTRSLIGDLQVFESHISKMISKIPINGSTVDLQDLFFKLTLDSATDFLFGQSTNVLGTGADTEKGEKFGDAFGHVTGVIGVENRVGKLLSALFRIHTKKFTDDIAYIHEYVGAYVAKALEQNEKYAGTGKGWPVSDRYVFINELSKTGYSARKIQDELLNILLAGRDTTASLLSHLWYVLARRPDVFEKLRRDVLAIGNREPSFEQIKEMKYLQYCLNETLRLYPVVPGNGRIAVNDTVLPVGGGPDGKSPIFIPKDMPVNYQVWNMHRRKDLYGEDAEEFKPERWETLRPSWQFLPFNGGPRICIGQQFALTEASYTTIRLLQAFKAIESRDPTEYKELLTLTMAVKGGVKVGLTPA